MGLLASQGTASCHVIRSFLSRDIAIAVAAHRDSERLEPIKLGIVVPIHRLISEIVALSVPSQCPVRRLTSAARSLGSCMSGVS